MTTRNDPSDRQPRNTNASSPRVTEESVTFRDAKGHNPSVIADEAQEVTRG